MPAWGTMPWGYTPSTRRTYANPPALIIQGRAPVSSLVSQSRSSHLVGVARIVLAGNADPVILAGGQRIILVGRIDDEPYRPSTQVEYLTGPDRLGVLVGTTKVRRSLSGIARQGLLGRMQRTVLEG